MALDIKICGLKTEAALAAALAGGAVHVGFIFFPKSPRNVEPAEAGRLRQAARGKAKAVAVTVDADDADARRIVAAMAPDMLQLHGSESPERVRGREGALRPAGHEGAFGPHGGRSRRDRAAIAALPTGCLFDAKPPAGSELPGGNGVSFDWRLLAGLDADVDYMLSGGLNAANIGEALRLANPPGIDVSSGVESAPGVKEPALIDDFFRRREASAQAGQIERGLRAAHRVEWSTAMNKPVEPNSFRTGPDEQGMFGMFGGRFVAETLMPLILELERHWNEAKTDPAFKAELDHLNKHYTGRPSPLYFAERLTAASRAAARRSISSATSSTTPARTRSTTASARSCSPSAWARRASSPRPAPASTASPRPPSRRASACLAWSIWARPTCSGRRPTSSA